MNTSEMAYALEQDPVTSKTFYGVFPNFSVLHRYPCGVVANTDLSNKPGTHWVAFYFSSTEKGEFFDSFGHSPDYYNNSFKSFLETHSSEWSFNNRKLQSA